MNKGPVNSRLFELRKKLNLSQLDFGKKISVSRSQVALLEKSQRTVNDRHIRLISSTFSVNPAWLRSGEGNMFITQEDVETRQNDEKEILDFYNQLMPEVRVFARTILKNLALMNAKILKK